MTNLTEHWTEGKWTRIVLHVLAAARDKQWKWHFAGIKREVACDMGTWLVKMMFGKVIGLDRIPKAKKKAAMREFVKFIKGLQLSYDPGTNEVNVKFGGKI